MASTPAARPVDLLPTATTLGVTAVRRRDVARFQFWWLRNIPAVPIYRNLIGILLAASGVLPVVLAPTGLGRSRLIVSLVLLLPFC